MARIKQVRKPLSFFGELYSPRNKSGKYERKCNCTSWLPSTNLLPADLAKDAHSLCLLHLWRRIAGKEKNLLEGRAESWENTGQRSSFQWSENPLPQSRGHLHYLFSRVYELLWTIDYFIFWTRIYIYIFFFFMVMLAFLCHCILCLWKQVDNLF